MLMLSKTKRTRVKQAPKRACYDRQVIYDIFGQTYFCHVGFIEDNYPVVIPMACWRWGNRIFIHAAKQSRLSKLIKSAKEVCLSVVILDGLVLAKSAFKHSMNYRSAMVFGKMHEVIAKSEQMQAYEKFVEHIQSGRWQQVRHPNHKELKMTALFYMEIDEASVKSRSGGPNEIKSDLNREVWTGVLPIAEIFAKPISAE